MFLERWKDILQAMILALVYINLNMPKRLTHCKDVKNYGT